MKDEKLFGHVTDEEAARIAEEYPTGDKKQRDRIFREIERRVETGSESGDEVRGVEAYRPRIWMKAVSAAAAFALVAGAVTGGGYLLYRNGGGSPGAEVGEPSSETETMDEEVLREETESAAETAGEEEQRRASEAAERDRMEEEAKHHAMEEIIAKIRARDYDAYDKINLKYSVTVNSGASTEHGTVKRDRLTNNESLIKYWSRTPEYYGDIDQEILDESGTTIEELAQSVTGNEMFMYKDMYICVYTDTGDPRPAQYEVMDRSECRFDDPNIFSSLYSEYLIENDLDAFDITDITEGMTFLGRDCTVLAMTSVYGDERYSGIPSEDGAPEAAPVRTPEAVEKENEMNGMTQELVLTVDNETGFILKAKLKVGDFYEEYNVEELRFNEDAEPPEDAEYIRGRIAECEPNNEITAAYDLSELEE